MDKSRWNTRIDNMLGKYLCGIYLFVFIVCCSGDGDNQCIDKGILLPYHCSNDTSECVDRRELFCDNQPHCRDGSDDVLYDHTKHSTFDGVPCKSRYQYMLQKYSYPTFDDDLGQEIINNLTTCLLPKRYVCDDEVDCVDGMDECECENAFKCTADECILKQMFCDGKVDCIGTDTDERPYNASSMTGFQCPVTITHITTTCHLDDEYVCDGFSDCDDGIDECFCDFSKGKGIAAQVHSHSNDRCFRCLDDLLVVPKRYVCDGIVHCADFSDECLCPTKNKTMLDLCSTVCPGRNCPVKCDRGQVYCVPINHENVILNTTNLCHDPSILCDNTYDCADHSDEAYCPKDDQTMKCHDNTTMIKKRYWCDNRIDCPDGSDEKYCTDEKHFCYYYNRPFNLGEGGDIRNASLREEVIKQIPVPGQKNRRGKDIVFNYDFPFYADPCDDIPTCPGLDDECTVKFNLCPNRTKMPDFCRYVNDTVFTCPNTKSTIIGVEICDGKPTCNVTYPWDSVDELHCPNRFYCADKGRNRLPIHVSLKERCNNLADCFDQSDELNCSEETHFYCHDKGRVSFVQRSKVCDGKADCKSGIDECQNCLKSPFSSDESLISSKFLVFMLWAMGLLATGGNVYVICKTSLNISKTINKYNNVAFSNRILVISLAFSDLLVGLYLISLGAKDAQFRGEYCLKDEEWRSSATCTALGSIAMLGTETSVIILIIMTTHRLYLVVKPFKKLKLTAIIVSAIACAWFFGAALAFVPLSSFFEEYFQSEVWYPTHAFLGKVNKVQLRQFTEHIVKYSPITKQLDETIEIEGYTWHTMIEVNKVLNETYFPGRFYGFYAAHGVCIPRLFPTTADDSYGYSLFIVVFNLLSFVYIMLAYVFIYTKTTRTTVTSTGSESRANSLQNKVTRIIITNFMCWIPICVMALINVAGITIPSTAYVVSAIILLPINSAFNPFLYTDLLDKTIKIFASIKNACLTPASERIAASGTTVPMSNGTSLNKLGTSSTNITNSRKDSRSNSGGSSMPARSENGSATGSENKAFIKSSH